MLAHAMRSDISAPRSSASGRPRRPTPSDSASSSGEVFDTERHPAAAIFLKLAGRLWQGDGFNSARSLKTVVKHVQVFRLRGNAMCSAPWLLTESDRFAR